MGHKQNGKTTVFPIVIAARPSRVVHAFKPSPAMPVAAPPDLSLAASRSGLGARLVEGAHAVVDAGQQVAVEIPGECGSRRCAAKA